MEIAEAENQGYSLLGNALRLSLDLGSAKFQVDYKKATSLHDHATEHGAFRRRPTLQTEC